MIVRPTPRIALSLLLLAACGGKDPETTATTSTTADTDATGPGVSTSGLSMSSSPTTTSEMPSTDPGTSSNVSITTISTSDPTTTTTGDPTTGPSMTSTGGEPECLIEQPRPGRCDAGKPRQPGVRLTDGPTLGARGPGLIANGDDEEFATTGCEFICPGDMGDAKECDIFAQDCGPGEKCNAWANDGGGSWNATKCVPVNADPDQVGEPCTVEGSPLSGIDSCAKGAMCWDVENNTGVCVEQCTCTIDNPVCTTQNTTCTISNNDSLALCLPVCDPLDSGACPNGDVCLAAGGLSSLFICVLDASGDQGKEGDDCEFQNACDPGLFCGANNGQCGGAGCCTSFCDLDAPACSGGVACTPFYEPGTAPKCFEDVGVCL